MGMGGLGVWQYDRNGKVCITVYVQQTANQSNACVSVHRKFHKVYQHLAAGIA
jgi:hypothetical protein